jgi:hypothetical protein
MKIPPGGIVLFNADGRTNEQNDEANISFSQFCEYTLNRF